MFRSNILLQQSSATLSKTKQNFRPVSVADLTRTTSSFYSSVMMNNNNNSNTSSSPQATILHGGTSRNNNSVEKNNKNNTEINENATQYAISCHESARQQYFQWMNNNNNKNSRNQAEKENKQDNEEEDPAASSSSLASSIPTSSSSSRNFDEVPLKYLFSNNKSSSSMVVVADYSAIRDCVCILLRAYCASGQINQARKLFSQFLREIEPQFQSTAVFDTWLQLLVQQPSINRNEVQLLLNRMQQSNLPKTAMTYQSLIEAHIRLQLDPSPLYIEMKKFEKENSSSFLQKKKKKKTTTSLLTTPSNLSLFVKGVAPFRTKEAEEANPNFHLDVLKDYLTKARPSSSSINNQQQQQQQQNSSSSSSSPQQSTTNTTPVVSFDYDLNFLKQRFLMFVNNNNTNTSEIPPEAALWLLFELEQRCVVECVSLREIVDRASLVQLLLRSARCGDANTVEGVIGVMERHLIPKSVDVLSLTLWAQAVAGRICDAFDTLEDMSRRGYLDHVDHTRRYVIEALGISVERHYLTTLADSLSTAEAIDKAFLYLESRYKQRGLSVSVHALDTIVLACGKIGDENRAVETLEAYPSLGCHPRIQSYNALLLSCTGRNKARRHRSVFEAMQRRGVTPNYHTLRILIRQAVLCNHIEEALEYLEKAKTTPGVRLDVEMILAIFERACRVGDLETSLIVSKIAMECDIGIDPAIIRVGAERMSEMGVDPRSLLDTISVHEKLRGSHGISRKL